MPVDYKWHLIKDLSDWIVRVCGASVEMCSRERIKAEVVYWTGRDPNAVSTADRKTGAMWQAGLD